MNSEKSLYFKVLPICVCVTLGVIAFFMILPFIWMISLSLIPKLSFVDLRKGFFAFVPRSISWKSYANIWVKANFARFFLNTTIFVGVSTVLTLFFSALGGYTFAKLKFFGRDVLFLFILFSMMIPPPALLIPRFMIIKSFPLAGGNNLLGQGGSGLVNTYRGLILPFMVTGFGIFLFRQFFLRLPDDMRSSAKIDGCSEFRIFWQIMLPLTKPAIIALTIFCFTWRWNELLWPLVVAQNKEMRVLSVGLATFMGHQQSVEQWNELMAASVVITLPVVLVFFLLQKHFTKGVSLTGLKG